MWYSGILLLSHLQRITAILVWTNESDAPVATNRCHVHMSKSSLYYFHISIWLQLVFTAAESSPSLNFNMTLFPNCPQIIHFHSSFWNYCWYNLNRKFILRVSSLNFGWNGTTFYTSLPIWLTSPIHFMPLTGFLPAFKNMVISILLIFFLWKAENLNGPKEWQV